MLDMASEQSGNIPFIGNCARPYEVDMADQNHAHLFRIKLNDLGLSQNAFSRVTGANERNVIRWAKGEQDIPNWVWPMITLMGLACPPKEHETPERYELRLRWLLMTNDEPISRGRK